MVGIARDVIANAAINRPLGIDSEEILAACLIDNLVRDQRPSVLDDASALRNGMLSE